MCHDSQPRILKYVEVCGNDYSPSLGVVQTLVYTIYNLIVAVASFVYLTLTLNSMCKLAA